MSAETRQIPDQFDGWLQRELQQRLSAITPANLRPAQARYQSLALSTSGGAFRLTKLKLAVAVAAGALAIGAAGAYAANTVTVQNPQSFTLGTGENSLNLITVTGKPISKLPTWTSVGDCVSFFASNRNYALMPQGYTSGAITISKANYHGKLVSFVASTWCKTQVTSTLAPDSTSPSAPASGTKPHDGGNNNQGQNSNNQGQNAGNPGKGNGQGQVSGNQGH